MGDITEALLLEISGHSTLEEIKELTLRKQNIREFSKYNERLVNLEALSLSHNKLTSLQKFNLLHNLTSLNLNFNSLGALSGVESLQNLQHLYVANNSIRQIEPLQHCTSLRILSLFKNVISDLDAAVCILAQLPKLKDLELGGNPCSQVPNYKERFVFELDLETFDGETLTDLDRQLAAECMGKSEPMFFDNQTEVPSEAQAKMNAARNGTETTSAVVMSPHRNEERTRLNTANSRPSTSARPSSACVQLYTDEILNDHPILLEYLARHVLTQGLDLVQLTGPSKSKSSFASKLRETAAVMSANEHLNPKQMTAKDCVANPKLAAVESLIAASTPNDITRQLIKLCEVLIKEVEMYRHSKSMGRPLSGNRPLTAGAGRPSSSGSGGQTPASPSASSALLQPNGVHLEVDALHVEVETLSRQVKVLTAENTNVYWLADENKKLRKELAELRAERGT